MEYDVSNQNEANPAKTSPPRLLHIHPRIKLFETLDEARQRALIWISAPAGSGKTVLAASYLKDRGIKHLWYQIDERDADPASFFYYLRQAAARIAPRKQEPLSLLTNEYLSALPVYTRNFFEKLYSRVKPPFFLVFDNLQDLPEKSALRGLWREVLDMVPEGVTVMALSRNAPPPALARLMVNQRMVHLNEPMLLLDPEEIRAIAELHQNKPLSSDALDLLHRTTRGWAAGVTLMLQAMGQTGKHPEELDADHSLLFDYFATEVFAHADPKWQLFMLATALFPHFSAQMAQSLTGNADAAEILRRLAGSNYFTIPLQGNKRHYQYHPLFRRYLLTQAHRQFTSSQLRQMQRTAGQALIDNGDHESAVSLLSDSQSWEILTEHIMRLGAQYIAQGRHLTLIEWLENIPEDRLVQYPWLLLWLAVAQLPVDPGMSRQNFKKALEVFEQTQMAEGLFLSWAGIIETVVHQLTDFNQLDHWFDRLENLMAAYGPRLTEEIETQICLSMYITCILRRPDYPHLPHWRNKVSAVFEKGADPSFSALAGFYLISHCLLIGDRSRAALAVEAFSNLATLKTSSPLVESACLLAKSWYGWATGDHHTCRTAAEEGLALAEKSGVLFWFHALRIQPCISALISGDLKRAGELLADYASILNSARDLDRILYYQESAWYALLTHDNVKAYELQSQVLDLLKSIGFVYVEADAHYGMFQVCHTRGDMKAARKHIDRSRELGELYGSQTLAFRCDMADAQYFFSQNQQEKGLKALKSALLLVKDKGYIAFDWFRRDVMSELCTIALQHDIEPDSAGYIIRQHRLEPDRCRPIPENWPWPVKIYTLGRFLVEIDGKRLQFSGKIQKKPLELLQAIIAMGPNDVPDERIIDALWAEADGDMARQAFRTAVSRLRRLLKNDAAITTGGGRIGLNNNLAWVDLEALVNHCNHILSDAQDRVRFIHHGDTDHRLAEIKEYMTEFLPGNESPWAISKRDKVNGLCFRALMAMGLAAQEACRFEQAIQCYISALEIDPLAEEIYQRLMVCYYSLGRHVDSIRIFHQCKKRLQEVLGIKPSSKTQEILERIVNT